jgi:uncharacterized membrane protein
MIEVTRPTTLPAEALWPVISQVRDWPAWLPTVDSVEPLEPGRPDEVGASYLVRQPRLPRATWTITGWRPGRSFTWESRAPGVTSIGRHELRPGERGTVVHLSLEWTGALSGLLRLLVGRRALAYVTAEAEALETTAATRSADT